MTFDSSQSDETYIIDAVGPTPDQNVAFVGVTTDTDPIRCPITVYLEIFDGVNWFGCAALGGCPWMNDYAVGTGFDIQTDDAATYADPANAQVVINCRIVATDPDSTSATSTIYEYFDISFVSACENDVITIGGAIPDSDLLVHSGSA